jgi:hypothetical protein
MFFDVDQHMPSLRDSGSLGLHAHYCMSSLRDLDRFLSEDPIGFEDGDANLQRYVGNGPTNLVDPSGLTNVEISQAASQRACQYEQFDRDLQRYVKARRQNPGIYGPRLNWRDLLMSFFGNTSTLDISGPGRCASPAPRSSSIVCPISARFAVRRLTGAQESLA